MAELEAAEKFASAANAGAESNHAAPAASGGEQEPDYYIYKNEVGMVVYTSKKFADGWGGCTIEPVYKVPPPPRGWLTNEEREAVETARDFFHDENPVEPCDDFYISVARVLRQILARSTPPEVVIPSMEKARGFVVNREEWVRRADVLAALAAAGVTVKEVGSE